MDKKWSQKKYKGSAKERKDLSRLYIDHDGNMNRIMESALCAEIEDEPRIRAILQSLIDAKEIPALKAFTHESAEKRHGRKRQVEKEREEAEARQRDMGISSQDNLHDLIKRRQHSREQGFHCLISHLEEKYAEEDAPKKKYAEEDTPKKKKGKKSPQ